jgi:hypothetical protein
MPSKTKKQLNFFKLVKAYIDGGPKELIVTWKNMYSSNYPTVKVIEKIKDVAGKINYADLEDMASGVIGDEVLGDKKDIKVGYWMKFESSYRDYHNKVFKNTFIAKITKIRPQEKLAIFNSNDLHNKNGNRIEPLRRISGATTVENIWLDYAYFNQIIETSKTKEELTMKNEIRKIVRDLLSEEFESAGLKRKKRNSNEEVNVKTGMFVQKKSDESKGKVKNVGINYDTVPATNNINVQWYHGDLAGTFQTVNPEDIEAI